MLGINLLEETKDMHSENYNTLMKKKIKEDTNRERYHILRLEKSILSKLLCFP